MSWCEWKEQHQPPTLWSSLQEGVPAHAAEMLPSTGCERRAAPRTQWGVLLAGMGEKFGYLVAEQRAQRMLGAALSAAGGGAGL